MDGGRRKGWHGAGLLAHARSYEFFLITIAALVIIARMNTILPSEPRAPGHRNLPKLHRSAYCGLAVVHWVFSVKDRRTGWLDEAFFLRFQIAGLHACLRYRVASPCYCLMPDHLHLLLIGHDEEKSDQTLAISFWRKQLKHLLSRGGYQFQSQPYDHVLRDAERGRDRFESHAGYILQNPMRAGLVGEGDAWPFEGAIVPGYPDLDPRQDDYWERFWKIYYGKLLAA